ncbi:MAG TPA: DMT family transporter [Gemmatimonadales bacterium]|nr:DMT family transporter [Gemmatimonadales bacterium]
MAVSSEILRVHCGKMGRGVMTGKVRMANSGLAWMLLAQFFFAAMNVCTRLAGVDLPWAEVGAARFLVGAIMAAALASYQGASLRITDRQSTWRRSVFGALSALCTFYALASSRIALGDVATLGATAPIFVAVLSGPLLGEYVGRRVALAIALVFAGVLAVVGPSFEVAAPVAGVAVSGAILYSLAMIWLRKIGPGESPQAVVLHFSLVGLCGMLAFAIPVWEWPNSHGALLLLGAGIAGGGAQIAMTRAYSLHRAAPLAALSGLGIVLTYLLAIPVFQSQPTLWQIVGSMLVIGASLLLATGAPVTPASMRPSS